LEENGCAKPRDDARQKSKFYLILFCLRVTSENISRVTESRRGFRFFVAAESGTPNHPIGSGVTAESGTPNHPAAIAVHPTLRYVGVGVGSGVTAESGTPNHPAAEGGVPTIPIWWGGYRICVWSYS